MDENQIDSDLLATASLSKDFMRYDMKGWGTLYTRRETERARIRYKSLIRNDPDFMKKKKDIVTPELFR